MENGNEGREAKRRMVVLQGFVHINGHSFGCRVRDVSTKGARVQIDVPLANSTPVHLELGRHGKFPAIVAWTEGELMGLVFPEGAAGALARFGDSAVNLGLVDAPAPLPEAATG